MNRYWWKDRLMVRRIDPQIQIDRYMMDRLIEKQRNRQTARQINRYIYINMNKML